MKTLKGLILSFAVVSLLAVAGFAGETNTPPCAPGETNAPPGETNGPPCASSSVTSNDGGSLGETQSPPATDFADTVISEAGLFLQMLL